MIKQRGTKGIWWCDFRDATGKRIRQSLETTDKKEAKEREARLIAGRDELSKGKQRGGITLREAFNHALRVRDDWRSAKSLHSIHSVYSMVEKYFGEDKPLTALTEDSITKYGEHLLKSGLKPSTINKRLSIISVLFEHAIKSKKYHGSIPSYERYKVDNSRHRLISPEEEALVISLLQAHGTEQSLIMADLVIVLADTGMRLSECLGVLPKNIHEADKAVLVQKTKNGDDRIVPLTDRALEVLKRRSQNTPMFHPLDVHAADYYWNLVKHQAGLGEEKEFVIHALRHTFASTLANAGVDAFRIQKVMGHKTIQTTEKYVKVATASLSGLADIMTNRSKKLRPKVCQKDTKMGTLGDIVNSDISIGYGDGVTPNGDLKSLGLNRPCRFDSGSGHQYSSIYTYTYTNLLKKDKE